MEKNNSIKLWRIIFTYMILIYHFDNAFPFSAEMELTAGWYIAVEFFFIVSGYLLYRTYKNGRYESAFLYTIHRLKAIYPKYIVAVIIVWIALSISRGYTYRMSLGFLADSYFELLLLQGIGLGRGWDYINPTLWYISVLLIAGYIIYFLLTHIEEWFVKFIAPVFVIFTYAYLYRTFGHINVVMDIEGFWGNFALLRGVADMCVGIIAAKGTDYLLQKDKADLSMKRIIGALVLLLVIVLSALFGFSQYDFLFVIMIAFGVATAFLPTDSSFINSKLIDKWSGMTLSIYLLHDLFRAYVFPSVFSGNYQLGEKMGIMCIYLITVTIAAALFDMLMNKVVKKF